MRIRPATPADEAALRELWEEFETEIPAPPEFVETWDEEWQDVEADIAGRGAVYLAEDDDGPAGALRATMLAGGVWHIVFAYVRPRARRRGLLKRLTALALDDGRGRGATRVTLDVMAANQVGVAAWRRLGFEPEKLYMAAPLAAVAERAVADERRPSHGALYVQTDDHDTVEQAVAKYLPRIGRSASTEVVAPSNGWTRVDDELCSRDPKALRRLGREVSLALGAVVLTLGVEEGAVVRYVLWDRGGIADEYASVPEFFGELPPGDVVALAANPTVAQRLTGADPARLRSVARTAASVDELPPPEELHAQLASVLGVQPPG
ncbi:MAG TPA: GNAT family N-acetyltransferase [Gaiellaceae bacterium]|nr:GNAT family N-acetyltransferase [Gaiellaceae bacterium]